MAKSSGTKLTDREVLVLAAVFARSNMGQALPAREQVQRALQATHPTSLSSEVLRFCEQFMENDEHQSLFENEAKMWRKILKQRTRESLQKEHGDIAALAWDMPVANKKKLPDWAVDNGDGTVSGDF